MRNVIISGASIFDVPNITEMQIKNHFAYLTEEERKTGGYVTVLTPPSYLHLINHNSHILMARYADGDFAGQPAGYLIWITPEQAREHEHPFLEKFGAQLSEKYFDFTIVVQVAARRKEVGKKSGIGAQLYNHLFNTVLRGSGTSIITEVCTHNPVSIAFHEKMGFEEYEAYTDTYGNNMKIIGKTIV